MPFAATGINSHLRLDPVTKKKCCPMAHKSDAHRITITTEDEAYIKGLTPDEVYIQKMSSMPRLSNDVARAVGSVLSPLFTACIESPHDAYRHRLLHVIFAILVRPLGEAGDAQRVIAERSTRVSEGGHIQELYERTYARPARKARRRQTRAGEEQEGGDQQLRTESELKAEKHRRRAVSLMHEAGVSAARRELESKSLQHCHWRTATLSCVTLAWTVIQFTWRAV